MIRKTILASALALVAVWFGLHTFAQDNPPAEKPTEKAADKQADKATAKGTEATVAAAKKFLAKLDDVQRGKAVFDFKDEAQRKRWSNLPTGIFRRAGLRMGDLTQPQRDAVMAVLAAALSPQGYDKVLQIVEAEEALRKGEGGGRLMFGRDEYYVSFLGQPSA